MSREEPKKLTIDLTSVWNKSFKNVIFCYTFFFICKIKNFKLVNLKAELLRKQDEFRLKKLSTPQNLNEKEYESHKVVAKFLF